MKSWPLTALLFVASCSPEETVEIPPVKIDGEGAHLMNDAKTPAEAYENAYASLSKHHLLFRKSLEASSSDFFRAAAHIRTIRRKLEIMAAFSQPPASQEIASYQGKYEAVEKHLDQRRAPGSLLTDVAGYEREIRDRFAPGQVAIIPRLPESSSTPAQPEPQAPASAATLPPPPEEQAPPALTPSTTPVPEKSSSPVPSWVPFKAWQQVHLDLTSAVRTQADASLPYRRVLESLDRLSGTADPARKPTLDLCRKAYEATFEKTAGFRTLPKGITSENILAELETVATILRSNFDPDAK